MRNNTKKYKNFMKCQNLIDFSERKVYATKKGKKQKETGGDKKHETGAETEKTHDFLLCDCTDCDSAVKPSAFSKTSRTKSNGS